MRLTRWTSIVSGSGSGVLQTLHQSVPLVLEAKPAYS